MITRRKLTMSLKDKIHGWINVSDDNYADSPDDEYDDDFDFQPGGEEETVQQAPKARSFVRQEKASNVVNINSTKPATSKPRVVFQKIDRLEDVTKVADVLKGKRIVVLNLETCPNDAAQRIIDVLYGVSYAGDGAFRKIADRAYIITPNNVPITGELGDEIVGVGEEEY